MRYHGARDTAGRACQAVAVDQHVPWFARSWTRPTTETRAIVGAIAYLVMAACNVFFAVTHGGMVKILYLAVAGAMLWFGATLVATIRWRRTTPSSP